MRVFDEDRRIRWLFCMTHPDDEISICVWIHRLVQNGNQVFVSWTHSNPTREREARAAAHLIGIPSDHLFFFGATDGAACDEIAVLQPKFEWLMETVRPDRVVCGAFEQGHVDHDTTNYLVNQTFSGEVFEVPFYHTYLTRLQRLNRFSSTKDQAILELNPVEQNFKKLIARQYPSQNIWTVLLWYEIYSKARLRPAVLVRTERMRRQTHFDFRRPNHHPRLAARLERSAPWRRWVNAIFTSPSMFESPRSQDVAQRI